MPRERFFNLPSAERDALLAAALHEFAEHGFDGASLNSILESVRLSKGAYYYYFDDKEDLFWTVLEHEFEKVIARVQPPSFDRVTHERFWSTLEAEIQRWSALWSESDELVAVFLHMSETTRRSPRFLRMIEQSNVLYRPVLEAGQRVGCIRRDLPVETLIQLFEATDLVLDRWFAASHPKKLPRAMLARHAALAYDTFRRLMATEPPRTRRKRRSS